MMVTLSLTIKGYGRRPVTSLKAAATTLDYPRYFAGIPGRHGLGGFPSDPNRSPGLESSSNHFGAKYRIRYSWIPVQQDLVGRAKIDTASFLAKVGLVDFYWLRWWRL
ncbi:MAG: hypothetical protein ABL933_18860 [Methyloglobulus sp.]